MNWRIKALAQKLLSAVPGGTAANDLLQRTVGTLRNFDCFVDVVVEDWTIMAGYLREVNFELRDTSTVEIGTGWYPTSPICFSLAGARNCTTVDIVRHLSPDRTFRMLRRLNPHLQKIANSGGRRHLDTEAEYRKLCSCLTLHQLLSDARVRYLAPADASNLDLPDRSVDIVYSNNVLEHVPPGVISAILRESYRVLRCGGAIVHSVNCGDHYAYFDPRITKVNYLRYNERKWAFWNNRLLYQNRLRAKDFISMTQQAGFRVILQKARATDVAIRFLGSIEIPPEFQAYSLEELAPTSIGLLAVRP